MGRSHLPAPVGNADHPALRAAEQTSLVQVGDTPVHTASEQRSPTGDLGLQVILSQLKPSGYGSAKVSQRVIAAIGKNAQDGRHQRLIIRYWHVSFLPVPNRHDFLVRVSI
jgi:hypothetical protein